MSELEFKHISVMLNECIEQLDIKPDGIYVDGTAGGAGHSSEIAKRLTTGKLIALDKDPDAIKTASERLAKYNRLLTIESCLGAAAKYGSARVRMNPKGALKV